MSLFFNRFMANEPIMSMKSIMYRKSRMSAHRQLPVHIALVILTEWVRGTASATYWRVRGKLLIGKTTPEKKNIGDNRPVM